MTVRDNRGEAMRHREISHYVHQNPDRQGQQPDTAPGNYYVSVIDPDTGRFGLLLGPFKNDHAAALAMVDKVRAKACDLDPRAYWYAFGTCRLPEDYEEPGRLNQFFFEGV